MLRLCRKAIVLASVKFKLASIGYGLVKCGIVHSQTLAYMYHCEKVPNSNMGFLQAQSVQLSLYRGSD